MRLMKVIATYAMLYMCVFAQAKEVKSLQSPRQWHVSISGNDSADGSATTPLRHIQTAAERAYPGDVGFGNRTRRCLQGESYSTAGRRI